MNHRDQCQELRRLRAQMRTATPEGQNQILKRISDHFSACEQCQEWWEGVWMKIDHRKRNGVRENESISSAD